MGYWSFTFSNPNAKFHARGDIRNLLDYQTVAIGGDPTMGYPGPSGGSIRGCFQFLFKNCTQLVTGPDLPSTTLNAKCYFGLFEGCTSLISATALPAKTIVSNCYTEMFYNCVSLETLPELPGITSVPIETYTLMFAGCSKIKLSETQVGDYQTAYRIPSQGTGSYFGESNMFNNTGGTFTGPTRLNTTYYTSNTVIPAG